MKAKCNWVLRPNSPGVNAVYCGKPVKYRMLLDDDDNKYRKYNAFCKEHQDRADAEALAEEQMDEQE